ncbi:AAA family ATPase [Photobacterium ganghwense]|uniref:AAA family ATPase n=1 Tax=Photobacterium ganghwense TaxID=320778 RepID=UPI001C2CE66C|nr:ATP-binding protein [Photobacterium ganghwense]MBV1843463.1 ATP-binding protein [Photobacterium ganghwense]
MIFEFSVTNFRSFKEKVTLSMVSNKGTEHDSNTFTPEAKGVPSLVNSAVVYGPNNAGKSNLIKAITAMKVIVLGSAANQRGEHFDVAPFLLDEDTASKPTEFEIVFISENVKYQYGFTLDTERVHEEWLFAYPNSRGQKWFHRVYSDKHQEEFWKFSDSFQGKKNLWKDSTKKNSLFLSTAIQLNSDSLRPVYDWFTDHLRTTTINGWNEEFSTFLCEQCESKEKILKFLQAADIDIKDLEVKADKYNINSIPDAMPDEFKKFVISELSDKEFKEVKTIRKNKQGNDVYFDFEDESDGTKKLFSFAGPWLDSLQNGNILCIDEMNNSLHSKIVHYLISLFHDKNINTKNAQLIFTTHDTSVLNPEIFRRDQIWFCDKNHDRSSILYPLTDFKARKNREDFSKYYLSGRYGALPFVNIDFFEELTDGE